MDSKQRKVLSHSFHRRKGIKKGKELNLCLFSFSFVPIEFSAISNKLIIKLTSTLAVLGFLLVVVIMGLNFLSLIEASLRKVLLISGFTLMLLGTLWRVVLEMNNED